MAEDKKAKETVQPEISVEQLQTENGELRNRVSELETRERVMSEDLDKAKILYKESESLKERVKELETENGDLKTKIEELSAEEIDSSSFRKVDKDGNVKIKFLLSPAGKFLLPFNSGQVVELPANQADEIVDCKYAEYVK